MHDCTSAAGTAQVLSNDGLCRRMPDVRCPWVVQENTRLATKCKQAEDVAASRQAALEQYTSVLSQLNAVPKPK